MPPRCAPSTCQRYADEPSACSTLKDIVAELEKPGRDPRAEFEVAGFRDDVQKIEDLKPGMVLKGIVTNVTPSARSSTWACTRTDSST